MQKKKQCNHILAGHITFGFLLVILACSMAFLKPAQVSAADLLDNLIVKAPENPLLILSFNRRRLIPLRCHGRRRPMRLRII